MAPVYNTGGNPPTATRTVPAPRPPGVPGATIPGAGRGTRGGPGPGAGRGPNRPGGRTPAQHIRPGGRPPGAGAGAREAAQDRREAAQRRGDGRPAPAGPERLSRNWLNWSPSQIQNFVRDRTAESVASERLPFQQQAGEIEGNARGASQRLGQAGSWMTGQMGALQAGAEGSAKTLENQVADRAVSQQNAINEQRNQAEKSFGGPLTPGLAGQFVAEQGEAQQAGTAAQRAAGERTQGENNFMRQLREAAAMRSMEGQNVAANTFAGQLGKTRAAERAQIGRVETRGQQEYPKMLQAQMNARLGLGKLGVAQAAVNQREAGNIRSNTRAETGNVRTNATRTATNAATNVTRAATSPNAPGSAAREGHGLTRLSAEERNDITAGKSGANKPMTKAQLAKVEGELGTAFAAFKQFNPQGITNTEIRNALPKGGLEGKRGGKAHTFKTGKPVGNQIFIRAAEEIWYNRQLSPEMKATFHELGIPEKAWSNQLLGAPKPANPLVGVRGSTGPK